MLNSMEQQVLYNAINWSLACMNAVLDGDLGPDNEEASWTVMPTSDSTAPSLGWSIKTPPSRTWSSLAVDDLFHLGYAPAAKRDRP